MATATTDLVGAPTQQVEAQGPPEHRKKVSVPWLRLIALSLGALVFVFPFYYMIVSALQREPNPNISGAFPNPGSLSLDNFVAINNAINLLRTLINSGLFTGGVLLGTLVFGGLAGYALAQLHFRGRQAVFFFRQFFMQIPSEMLEGARIDGASELAILTRVVAPLTRPAILTATLITFIGPWNEFLWPFLITKRLELEPLAVALANYISTVAQRAANPYGTILAGATVLAIPVVILFLIFQRQFIESSVGSSVKG